MPGSQLDMEQRLKVCNLVGERQKNSHIQKGKVASDCFERLSQTEKAKRGYLIHINR